MPTPFMHLAAAHRLLTDSDISPNLRETLSDAAHLGAFLLGNVAPDARVSSGLKRDQTHFFEYAPTITPYACEAMLAAYPDLAQAKGAQRAFICGYMAHLAMDVVWAEVMLFPHFYSATWSDQIDRYNMLHVLLCFTDERDYGQWPAQFAPALADALPQTWLPFLPDEDLAAWRDIIARQIAPDGQSATVEILGKRVMIGAEGLHAVLESPSAMQSRLWDFVSLAVLADVEARMYSEMVAWVQRYMGGENLSEAGPR